MISSKEFIERLQDHTRKYQSAFETGPALTGKINLAQNELAEHLYSIYEINQRAVDLLSPLVVDASIVANSTGIITLPEAYNHKLSFGYVKNGVEHPANYLGASQVAITEKLPQRRGDLSKNRVNYTFVNKKIQLFPKSAIAMKLVYVKYPVKAKIAYTYSSAGGEDIRVYDQANSVDMEWGENCFNLLLYMTLDKMGISSRDEILREYAQLGIAKEEVKPIN